MLAAVAPRGLRSTVMAWAYAIELAGAAVIGPPIVAAIAEGFGYVASQEVDVSNVPEDQRVRNTSALRNALTIMFSVPFVISAILYAGALYTYPKDRDAHVQY